MKKCNICGIQISPNSEKVICDSCDNKNQPLIKYDIQRNMIFFTLLIIGIIYTYGGFFSLRNKEAFFDNSFYWLGIDLIGCFLVYKCHFTPVQKIISSEGLGPFFGIPLLTLLGIINLFLLPILPNMFTEFFYAIVSFPPLNFFVGLACVWTVVSELDII